MKVGVFVGNYSPEAGGGYTFQQEICRAIESFGPASGHTFVFFTYSQVVNKTASADDAFRYISIVGEHHRSRLTIRCLRAIQFFARTILCLAGIKNHDRNADPISSHIREESIDVTWSLTPACLSTEVPFITTVWDLEHRLQPYFPEVSLKDEWDGREKHYSSLLGRAAFVITGTQAGKLEIEKFYHVPSNRIKVLAFPTPQIVFPEKSCYNLLQKKYGIPDNYLFYPAQFWPHKNHFGVLMAIQALREKYNLILPVVFVGSDMGNLTYIRKVVDDMGLTGQVYFLGFVPRDDLATLYSNAFALLYLSLFGPDNLPPLEAFALGCPVIASNVSGSQEQLGDAALLVDPIDPTNIADAVYLLLDVSFRQTLVDRGLKRASIRTGENYFKGVCSLFDEFESIRRTWSNAEPFRIAR